MAQSFLNGRVTLHPGDSREVVPTLADNSIDACVTDPPYGLAFMGRAWDHPDNIAFRPELWAEALRVLKPGGHLLAFGGTRMFHRLVCAIEDAGFEVRDTIMWVYGQGFPKSLDVSKAFDKAAGAEREVVGRRRAGMGSGKTFGMLQAEGLNFAAPHDVAVTTPATDLARQWQGFGTALKPAVEPICLARKPLDGTVAETVSRWGTGALNIDGCSTRRKSPSR